MVINKQQISIIIPAYNEELSIIKCLEPLIKKNISHNLQIIVVCNGCQDKTHLVVKSLDSSIVCLETNVASKTNALNLGDKIAKFYPRIYLDADVVLSVEAINEMCSTLKSKNSLATSIIAKMDVSSSSWLVRAFYDIWLNLPYCKVGMVGSGVYALSKEGRARFKNFPDIIADDGYVRCLFKDEERPLTLGHYAIVTAPKDLISLIKIKTRSRLGRYELQEKFPELLTNETKNYQTASIELLLNFKLWFKVIVYLSVNIIARIRAKYQFMKNIRVWERDESSRS